jgi:hypothetical protein
MIVRGNARLLASKKFQRLVPDLASNFNLRFLAGLRAAVDGHHQRHRLGQTLNPKP